MSPARKVSDHRPQGLHAYLDLLKQVSDVIALSFGSNCEVVIHDLTKPSHSVVHIVNGHVTGRGPGDAMQSSLMEALMRRGETDGHLVNYVFPAKDGRLLRCSSVIISDAEGEPVGALSINYDITQLKMVEDLLSQITSITRPTLPKHFPDTFDQILDLFLDEATVRVGRPVPYMRKSDKIEVVRYLDSRGAFQLRESMARVAAYLDVSKFTVYNYLQEVRSPVPQP